MKKIFNKKLSKIVEYGLYFLAFILPWQTRWIIKPGEINNGYSEYLTISLYIVDVLIIFLIILLSISKLKEGLKEEKINIFWWLIAGLELAVFVSIFFATDKELAIFYYFRFLLGIGFFWLIASASYSEAKFILSLLSGFFTQALLAIWQFITQSTFSFKWLGLASHYAGELGVSVVEVGGERWLRAYGGLDHPNMLGGVMAVGIILVLLFELNIFKRKLIKENLSGLLKIFGAVFLIALFFSFSRSAWLGLIVGLMFMLFISWLKKDLISQKKILEYIFIFGIIIFILSSQYNGLVSNRIKGEGRIETNSINERIELGKEAIEIIKTNLFFGTGVGNYVLEQKIQRVVNQSSWEYQPVHNYYLLVWSEIGVVGILIFLSIIIFLICSIFSKSNQKIIFGLMMILITMFFFDHWWWSLHFGVIFSWLIFGIVLRLVFKK